MAVTTNNSTHPTSTVRRSLNRLSCGIALAAGALMLLLVTYLCRGSILRATASRVDWSAVQRELGGICVSDPSRIDDEIVLRLTYFVKRENTSVSPLSHVWRVKVDRVSADEIDFYLEVGITDGRTKWADTIVLPPELAARNYRVCYVDANGSRSDIGTLDLVRRVFIPLVNQETNEVQNGSK